MLVEVLCGGSLAGRLAAAKRPFLVPVGRCPESPSWRMKRASMSPQGVAQGRLGQPYLRPTERNGETGGAPGRGRNAESLALGEREVTRLACLRSG